MKFADEHTVNNLVLDVDDHNDNSQKDVRKEDSNENEKEDMNVVEKNEKIISKDKIKENIEFTSESEKVISNINNYVDEKIDLYSSESDDEPKIDEETHKIINTTKEEIIKIDIKEEAIETEIKNMKKEINQEERNDFDTSNKEEETKSKKPTFEISTKNSNYVYDGLKFNDEFQNETLNEQKKLEKCWKELGLTKEEIEKEKENLLENIIVILKQEITNSKNKKNKLQSQLNEMKSSHIQLLKAIGYGDENAQKILTIGISGTLRNKLRETMEYVKNFKSIVDERIRQFDNAKKKLDILFNKLGYSDADKGEFVEIGKKDLKEERLQRFNAKILELEKEVEEKTVTLEDYKNFIITITKEINIRVLPEIQELFDNGIISRKAFQRYQNYKDEIDTIHKNRSKRLSFLIDEIQKYCDFLKIPEDKKNKIIKNQNCLTEENIKIFEVELEKLKNEVLKHIDMYKNNIKKFYQELNYSDDNIQQKIQEIENTVPKPDDKLQVYFAFECHYQNMKKMIEFSKTIIQLINQREDILREYNDCIQEEQKNKKIDPIKIDKIKRRYKTVLPRVQKKLLLHILEYKNEQHQDFMWDGQKVEDSLQGIKLSPTEMLQFKNERRKSQTRKSIDAVSIHSKRRDSNI